MITIYVCNNILDVVWNIIWNVVKIFLQGSAIGSTISEIDWDFAVENNLTRDPEEGGGHKVPAPPSLLPPIMLERAKTSVSWQEPEKLARPHFSD